MGCPTVTNFKHILRQQLIKNCPVTLDNIDQAEKIFGLDMGTLKGKSTQKKPTPVKHNNIDIPPEILEKHYNMTLCIDIMFVNFMPMFTTINWTV